jgi:amidohydrolase
VEIGKLKALVAGEIEPQRDQLRELALRIHANPELGFQEFKAAEWLTQYLEKNGFSVERGICQLPTAFRASYGQGRPAIAFLAEYDALAGIGHACGHNIIATSSVGAALGARRLAEQCGGTILVIGTPAEEGYGGKAIMADRGAFENLDVAMMIHPEDHDAVTAYALACQTLEVEFFGKAAHAAARPDTGINALEAMLLSFTAINSLRQHIRSSARIHGIITDGGQAANVVPDHSAGSFIVRARDNTYLDELEQKVINCFTSGATATGARLKYRWDEVRYATMRNNLTMAELFRQNMRSLGRDPVLGNPDVSFGSTDMGNVSHLVPAIHPYVAISPKGIQVHTTEFAAAAASEAAIKGMLDAAKALAMTAVDLLANPKILAKVKEEFKQGKQ